MITNEKALQGLNVINALLQTPEKKPTKFVFALVKNKQSLESIAEAFNKTLTADIDPDFEDFQNACINLADDFAQKTTDNISVTNANGQVMIDPTRTIDYDRACMAMASSKSTWQKALQRRMDMIVTLNNTDSKFTPYQISLSNFPNEISGTELEYLYFMIKD